MTSPVHTVTNAYETKRDVLVSKENKAGTNMISKHAYTVNNLLQRTQRVQTGTAFGGSMTENYAYNTRSEITATNNPTQSVLNTAYTYDGIGNRKTASFGGNSYGYTTNNLNQYSALSVSSAVKTPTYDLDGNLTFDGSQSYIYDAENRLIKVIKSVGNEVRYAYDVLSRRVKREVVEGGSIVETTNYTYAGWNLIAEDTGGRISRSTKYIWGLGYAGNLLMTKKDSKYIFPAYDGNGNVSELLDASGNICGHYEYDAFGNAIIISGIDANDNSWRFGTKPFDEDVGLYYYGFRFYNPKMGRWINRDPSGEIGGLNLYGFVNNNSIDFIDPRGLSCENICEKEGIKQNVEVGANGRTMSDDPLVDVGKLKKAFDAINLLDSASSGLQIIPATTKSGGKFVQIVWNGKGGTEQRTKFLKATSDNELSIYNLPEEIKKSILDGVSTLSSRLGSGYELNVTYEECEKERCGIWGFRCDRLNWKKRKDKYVCYKSFPYEKRPPVYTWTDEMKESCRKEAKEIYSQPSRL